MAGNAKSGATLKQTMIKKYGSQEAWSEHMRQIGTKGGSKIGVLKGFAANHSLAIIAGGRGGRISKRNKKVLK